VLLHSLQHIRARNTCKSSPSSVLTNPLVTASNGGSSPSRKPVSDWNFVSHSKITSLPNKLCQSGSYLTTNGQSDSPSWYLATIWDPRPTSLSLHWKSSLDICVFKYEALFLTRERGHHKEYSFALLRHSHHAEDPVTLLLTADITYRRPLLMHSSLSTCWYIVACLAAVA
jgi:hypothetical protein